MLSLHEPSRGGAAPPLLVLLIAAAGGVGVLGFLLMGQMQQTKRLEQELNSARQQIQDFQNQNLQLTEQINGLQDERKELEGRINAVREQLTSVTTQLERSQLTLQEAEARQSWLSEERTHLQTQVASLTTERDTANTRIRTLEQDKAERERSLSRARQRIAFLDREYRKAADRVAQLELMPNAGVNVIGSVGPSSGPAASASTPAPSAISGAVELPPIVVQKDQSAAMGTPVRGRLLEVNSPHRFVVVDKGSDDGVRVGMAFDVVRGSATVGRATAVRVHPKLSACDIIPARTPGPLQAGDLAVQSGS